MTKLSISSVLALAYFALAAPQAGASDSAVEAKCRAQIKQNFKEPKEIKSDPDYRNLKLKASVFVEADGRVASVDLQRKSEKLYLPAPGQKTARAPEPDYIGLSTAANTKAAENAFLSAIKRSSPFPVAGSSYAGPYSTWVEYSPGAKPEWTFRLGPAPQKRPRPFPQQAR